MRAHYDSVELRYGCTDEMYGPDVRKYQGVPTLAITKGGRMFLGWCSGGNAEPRIENYDILHYSDDFGKTFKKTPVVVIDSDREKLIHAFDLQLWVDPDGALHVVWVQEDARPKRPDENPKWTPENPIATGEGYVFDDFEHASWEIVCKDPDADELVFSEPVRAFSGFLRCKPLVTKSGKIFAFAYDQLTDRYTYNVSCDGGKTWVREMGGKKVLTPFDEGMAYQLEDGTIRMLARCEGGELAETYSYDDGESWTDGKLSGIVSPSSRFYVSRTPTGRLLLALNDAPVRRNMTVKLSEDDGKTWKYSLSIDERADVSYPEADFYDGKIYLTYDRGRKTDNEILLVTLTEDEIINGVRPEVKIVSKPGVTEV